MELDWAAGLTPENLKFALKAAAAMRQPQQSCNMGRFGREMMGGIPVTTAHDIWAPHAAKDDARVFVGNLGTGQKCSVGGKSNDYGQRGKRYPQVGDVPQARWENLGVPTVDIKSLHGDEIESEDEFTPAFAEDFEACQQGQEKYCVAPLPFCPSDLPFKDMDDVTPFCVAGFCGHCGKAVRSNLQTAKFCVFCGKDKESTQCLTTSSRCWPNSLVHREK